MAFLMPLALFAMSVLSPLQDDTPVFPEAKIVVKENNWIQVRPKLISQGEGKWTIKCKNACNGKKHTLHQECDLTCDSACTEIHKYSFEPIYTCRPGGDIKSNGQKFGLPDLTWTVLRQVSSSVHKEFRDKVKNYNLGHWNKTPCSESLKNQVYVEYKIQADYQFFRNDIGPDGKEILVKGPSGTWDYGSVEVPKGDLTDGETIVNCRCSVVNENYTEEGTGVYFEENGKKELGTAKKVDEKLSIDCPSMNEAIVNCTNEGANDLKVFIGPGTILDCIDDSCQDEMVMEPTTLIVPAYGHLRAFIQTRPFEDVTGTKARAACINMHRPEPRSGVKYAFAMPTKESIVLLAKDAAKQSIHGSWEQIRLWIVTDYASLDDMAKVLFPRPRQGPYLNALYDVSRIAGMDVNASEYKACLDPGLIIGGSAVQEATDWYVDLWARKDPKVLAAWLNQHMSDFANECFGANPTDYQIAHAADVFNALCSSGVPVLVDAGLTGLEKAVPADKRALVASAHGLEGALSLLGGTDAKTADRALKVAELYRDAGSRHNLLNVSESLGDAVKTKAAKIYGEIGGP